MFSLKLFNTLQKFKCNLLTNNLKAVSLISSNHGFSSEIIKTNPVNELTITKNVIEKVNSQITNNTEGRLFAVTHLCGKQFKITAGDIILVEGYWPPQIGDKITLDKILLVGSKDFSLIGTPILEKGLVDVQATIIEKTLTHTKTNFRKKRRKQFMRINFQRSPNTMLMINSIEIKKSVNSENRITPRIEQIF